MPLPLDGDLRELALDVVRETYELTAAINNGTVTRLDAAEWTKCSADLWYTYESTRETVFGLRSAGSNETSPGGPCNEQDEDVYQQLQDAGRELMFAINPDEPAVFAATADGTQGGVIDELMPILIRVLAEWLMKRNK